MLAVLDSRGGKPTGTGWSQPLNFWFQGSSQSAPLDTHTVTQVKRGILKQTNIYDLYGGYTHLHQIVYVHM